MSFAQRFRFEPSVTTIKAGDVLFEQGDAADALYIVLGGTIEIRLDGTAIETVDGDGVIGEMALIDGEARSATAIALTDATVAPIDRKRFLYLIQNTPTFALDVMAAMAGRLRRSDAAARGPRRPAT